MLEFLTSAGGGGTSVSGGTSGTGEQKSSFTGGAKFSQVGDGDSFSSTIKWGLLALVVLVVGVAFLKR